MPNYKRWLTPAQQREQAAIRAALDREVEGSSLRAVARQVKMAPSGLRAFLDGRIPYGPTLSRLRDWYYIWRHGGELTADTVEHVIPRLLRWLPDPDTGLSAVLEFIGGLHRASGIAIPLWLTELRSRSEAPARFNGTDRADSEPE